MQSCLLTFKPHITNEQTLQSRFPSGGIISSVHCAVFSNGEPDPLHRKTL
jgi:hypothetical protein